MGGWGHRHPRERVAYSSPRPLLLARTQGGEATGREEADSRDTIGVQHFYGSMF